MKTNSLARFVKWNGCLLALVAGAVTGLSQIVIGPSGTVGPLTFDTQPTVAEGWSTAPDDNGDAGNDTTPAQMDAGMQTNNVANIVTRVGSSSTDNPPSANAIARWHSVRHVLMSRATSVRNTKLLATLQNNTGSSVATLNIEYDLNNAVADGSTITESPGLYGWRVYWSLTGLPDSWTVIPALSGVGDPGHLTASINVVNWQQGANLYILWLDDNGPSSTTAPNEEGWYSMDNVVFTAVSGSGPLSIANTNLPLSVVTNEYANVSFTFAVAGGAPTYQWYKDGQAIVGATNATYSLVSVVPTNSGNFYAIAQNSFNSVTSRVASLAVDPDEVKPAIASIQIAGASVVNVVFTEAVKASTATNLANYSLETLSGTPIPIASATLAATNVVRLTLVSPRGYAVEDLITVRGVEDRAYNPNTMLTQTEVVPAEYTKPLFPMDHVWKYETNGLDLGTAWKEEVYDDSAWLSGQGILGHETTAATVAAFNNAGESVRTPFGAVYTNVITYYYRTTFVVTGSTAGLGLVAEGWIDDGAIFWLNGQRAGWIWPSNNTWTPRIDLPDPVTYTTMCYDDITDEVTVKTIVLDPIYLRQGTNTLAVEVHQNSATSSDTVMGIRLNQVIPAPIAITSHPVGTNIFEGQTATLSVGISGSLPNYQWYFNNQPIAGANSATYTISPALTNNSGNYFVIVSNATSKATSQVATVVVRVDSFPPVVTYSVLNTNNYGDTTYGQACTVTIQFSEPVNPADATNIANYFISPEGSATNNTLTIYEAALDATGTNLTLVTSVKQETTPVNYRLYIGNIHDLAPNPNVMPATMYFMYQRLFLMYGAQTWKYDWSGANLGTAWKEPTYNDGAWASSPGPFYSAGENGNANFPTGWGEAWVYTPSSTTVTTYYYRTTFNLPGDPAGVRLQFEIAMDDGGLFWLNGAEVKNTSQNGRYYMPNGTNVVYATSFATDHEVGTPSQRTPVYPIALKSGANVLAVEVHQSANDITNAANDHVFALQIVATLPPIGKPLKPLLVAQPANITVNEGNNVTFTAYGDGTMPVTARWYFNTNTFISAQTLTSATNVIALTRNNVGAANEGTYTLVLSNAAGMVTSTVATLTVLRPPTFTLQPVSTNAAVGATVTFTAAATGTLPINLQWYFNGTDRIYGETNATLTLLNVQPENAGTYTLRAWNTIGTNNSAAATLTVSGGTASQPRLTNLVFTAGGGAFNLKLQTEAGHTYILQYNDNLSNPTGWQPVPGASVVGDGTLKSLADSTATVPKRFYRVAVQ